MFMTGNASWAFKGLFIAQNILVGTFLASLRVATFEDLVLVDFRLFEEILPLD